MNLAATHSAGDVRVTLAGAGAMARRHLDAIDALPGSHVVALADPSASARERLVDGRSHAPATASTLGEALAAADSDVVHVCTPMEAHGPLAMEAMAAGRHVYVEKPVATTSADLEALLRQSERTGRRVCAGHQLLFHQTYRDLLATHSDVGEAAHVESYFSFRPVRTAPEGRRPLSLGEQLLDVLPHPTYLLVDLLARLQGGAERAEGAGLRRVEVTGDGTAHALVRLGEVTGCLIVSVSGRPVEHRLKLVGAGGTVEADFVRGTVQRLLGPGSSSMAKALAPFRLSAQLTLGSALALGRRALTGSGGYPGLAMLIQRFHAAVRAGAASPTPPDQLRSTVTVGEALASQLFPSDHATAAHADPSASGPRVLVTGGTGFLGRHVVRQLRADGISVRSVARRPPERSERLEGVEYRAVDLAHGVPDDLLEDVETVIHCAAETRGGRDAHQRNSVGATSALVRAAARHGVRAFVHVSSVAVQGRPSDGRPLRDEDPIHPRPQELGPYVAGKAEAERRAVSLAQETGLRLKVVRPLPLVSSEGFQPPGRLGRRLGGLYVAVGSPDEPLAVADVAQTARAVVRSALEAENTPDVLNLVPPRVPTRRQLVERARAGSPGLSVIWLPWAGLHVLSWGVGLAGAVMRPRTAPMRLASAFERLEYAPGPAAAWMEAAEPESSPAVGEPGAA